MSRPFPWRKPTSVYDDAGPSEPVEFELCGMRFAVRYTGDTGINTGRGRYQTECLTCPKMLHARTTGPAGYILAHLECEHDVPRAQIEAMHE